MPRRVTPLEVGEYYHVYNRGCNRDPIFITPDNYLFFLTRARDLVVRASAEIVAYCLMPNHYHFLVHLLTDGFSDSMQQLGVSYSKAFNKQQGRVGPRFQGPFRAIIVDRDEYLLHLSRYIRLNPLAVGLVSRAEEWSYSSYQEYIGLRQDGLAKPEVILELLGSRQRYRDFVEGHRNDEGKTIGHLLIDDD